MHRNGNLCNSFLMVKMASGMDHGRVRPTTTTTTTTTNDVAQHGGHPANTKLCSLGLQHISLILDMHIIMGLRLAALRAAGAPLSTNYSGGLTRVGPESKNLQPKK